MVCWICSNCAGNVVDKSRKKTKTKQKKIPIKYNFVIRVKIKLLFEKQADRSETEMTAVHSMFLVHTLWVLTSQNRALFAETLGTQRGRPVWAEASSLFHGRTTSCLLTPASSHVMKGNSRNMLFIKNWNYSESERVRLVWFTSSYLCYSSKYDHARCGTQYKAFVWSRKWLISLSMFCCGPAVPGGQPRKTGTCGFS